MISAGSRIDEAISMQYRVQFLDRSDNVVREVKTDARSSDFPLLHAVNRVWPPQATRVRVIYPSGHVSTSKVLAQVAA
jgi:hypothetical protein